MGEFKMIVISNTKASLKVDKAKKNKTLAQFENLLLQGIKERQKELKPEVFRVDLRSEKNQK
jgi:hypothetical protein